MSLISDALKTAERQQRSRGGAPAEHPFFDGYFPHTSGHPASSSRRVLLGVATFLLAATVTSLSVIRLRAEPAVAPHPAARPRVTPPPRATSQAVQTPLSDTANSAVSSGVALPEPAAAARTESGTGLEHRSHPGLTVPAPARARRAAADSVATPATPATPRGAASIIGSPTTVTPNPPAPAIQIIVDSAAPRPVDAIMGQALTAQRHGDYATAKDLYDRAIKVGPVSAALYNNYGALLHDMGNSRDAVAMLRLALSLDQTFANAWVNLGNAQDALGDRGAAVSAYNQALKLDPANRDSKVGLAWQYIAVGSFLDARRLLSEVLRASPDFAPAHYALGEALEGDKDSSGAVREFSRFLELGGAAAKPGLEQQVRAHIAALGKLQ